MPRDNHAKGVLIAGAGVLAISPDSLLIRLVTVDPWTLLFWRGLLSALAILAGLAVLHRRRLPNHLLAIGGTGIWLAVLFGVGNILFILSITSTKVANTLFIVSSAPLFAAIISRIFLHEIVPARTWLAIVVALAGIALIASSSLDQGRRSLLGDLAAVGTAISMAASFALARLGRANSMVPAVALAALLTALVAWPLAAPLGLDAADGIYLAVMGLVVLPLGFGLLTLGPRYLPAPEVSLLLLLEAILGPFWVWLVVGENPGPTVLVGGAIVIATLVALNLHAIRMQTLPVSRSGT